MTKKKGLRHKLREKVRGASAHLQGYKAHMLGGKSLQDKQIAAEERGDDDEVERLQRIINREERDAARKHRRSALRPGHREWDYR